MERDERLRSVHGEVLQDPEKALSWLERPDTECPVLPDTQRSGLTNVSSMLGSVSYPTRHPRLSADPSPTLRGASLASERVWRGDGLEGQAGYPRRALTGIGPRLCLSVQLPRFLSSESAGSISPGSGALHSAATRGVVSMVNPRPRARSASSAVA